VVADIAKLSVGREAYYARELATDHQQYLSGHGESPGRWYGAGASRLGLQGEASPAGFQAMFEGRDPTTGELLGRPHGSNAVPAFDVVLRPTKSVSILYGLGDPATGRAVLAAHHAGLAEAVGYLDEHLGARRGHGGVQHVSGQGLLLTTQYLDEADRLADQIVIIDHGRAIEHGTPAELKQRAGSNVIEIHVRDRGDLAEVARALSMIGNGEAQVDASTHRVTVAVTGGTEWLNRALLPLEQRAIALQEVALRPPRLDEAFLALTRHVPKEVRHG
jgi:TrwC relaxase